MTNFKEDENLGKVIESKLLYSFGAAPLTGLKELVFAAGGDKFSSLCGFKFISKAETEYKEFFIAFVCKLRSKIFNAAINNPSQWFIFKKVSSKEMDCLDKKSLLDQYGFDLDKFYDSDYFAATLPKFKATINKGLKEYVPAYVKEHGNELAIDNLTSYDGQVNATVKDAVGRYVEAIKDSLKYIDDTKTNNKFYKLISYDLTVESMKYDDKAWKELHKKWEKPRTDGDILVDIEAVIPDLKKTINDQFKGHLEDYQIENAITYVLDNEGGEDLWNKSLTAEEFIKNVVDVASDGRAEFKESLNEDKLVEAKWDCYVKEEGEDKFGVYEKTDDVWVATFASKKAAEDFAKSYPDMKAKYIKSAQESELNEADDRELFSHALDIVDVKASTANTSAQDEVEMTVIDTTMDDEIEEAMKEIYK